MMECDVIQDLLPLYADDQASEASRRMVEEHVRTCAVCRKRRDAMCAPMEPEPVDETLAYLDAIHAQKRKNRRRMVAACVLMALVCLIGWWLTMEYRFQGSRYVQVSTDPSEILAQMPALALTEEELALADRILEIPAIRDGLESGEVQSLPLEEVEADIRSVLPEDAEYIYVDITGKHHVYIDYRSQGIRVILSYADVDGGKADAISKTIGVPKSEEDWSAVEVYQLQYSIALDRTWYEKSESQHIWFSFLHMP